jgi:hypothetical protein
MPTIPYVRATHVDGNSFSAAKANVIEAGVNDVSFAPAVRAYHNANQSLTTATATALAFNSERFDQAGGVAATHHDVTTNNSRLTCLYAGIYQISGNIEWPANATGIRILIIRLNGTTEIARTAQIALSANALQQNLTGLYSLAVNDYLELVAYQNSGAGLNVNAQPNQSPEFMMVRVG